MDKENLRKAIISILIGTAISILTILFQALTGYLTQLQPEIGGAVVGIAKYLRA